MVPIGYASLTGVVVWLFKGGGLDVLGSVRPRAALLIRFGASLLSVLLSLIGVTLLTRSADTSDELARVVVSTALIIGGLLFSTGTALWRGRLAQGLRAAGWCILAAALSVPTSLTPLLLLLALAGVTLGEVRGAQDASGTGAS